jgi:hypothetical protein
MANTAGLCYSYLVDILDGTINTDTDSLKIALIDTAGTQAPSTTTNYSSLSTDELTGTNYTAGGVVVTNGNSPANTGATAYWTPSTDAAWTTLTSDNAFDAALLYSTTATNAAMALFTFSSQDVTAADFTLVMPTNDSATGLIRVTGT